MWNTVRVREWLKRGRERRKVKRVTQLVQEQIVPTHSLTYLLTYSLTRSLTHTTHTKKNGRRATMGNDERTANNTTALLGSVLRTG